MRFDLRAVLPCVALATGCGFGPEEAGDTAGAGAPEGSAPVETPPAGQAPVPVEGPSLEIHRAAVRPGPITGGTLAVTPDARFAVLADADRGRLLRVALSDLSVVETPLELGDEPGRVVLDASAETAYVVLRGAGAVLALNVASGTQTWRAPACGEPRGVTVAASGEVVVAFATGRVVRLAADDGALQGEERRSPDLRDVVTLEDGTLRYTTFRGAVIGEPGEPPPRIYLGLDYAPAVAWRTISLPDGGSATIHQLQRVTQLPQGAPYYAGTGCAGGIVLGGLSLVDGAGERTTMLLGDLPLPVDVAAEPGATWFGVVAAGAGEWNDPNARGAAQVRVLDREALTLLGQYDCVPGLGWETNTSLEPVAVAATADALWVQSREPAALVRLPVSRDADAALVLGTPEVHPLGGPSVADTGHMLFHHAPPGTGVACASCHPEGEDDGHVWDFQEFGLRRTPAIHGGLLDTAPYHWSGDLADFDALVDTVMTGRMLAPPLSAEAKGTLADYVDTLRPRRMADAADAALAEAGRALFFDASVGCATCHVGGRGSDDRNHDVGTGGVFQTPLLRGLAPRAPFMHDGCAADLGERFADCGGSERHGHTAHLSDTQRAALVAYLTTL